MKLPGSDQAIVEEAKISGYLLSESHSVGKFKAPFFMALGYSAPAWEILAADLRNLLCCTARMLRGSSPQFQGQEHEHHLLETVVLNRDLSTDFREAI